MKERWLERRTIRSIERSIEKNIERRMERRATSVELRREPQTEMSRVSSLKIHIIQLVLS